MEGIGTALGNALSAMIYTPAAEDGDYTQDGLLYCGKCKTRRQMTLDLFGDGEFRRVPVMCDCEEQKHLQQIAEDKARQEAARIKHIRQQGIGNQSWLDASFEHDDGRDEKASAIARRYVEHFEDMSGENIGLMLYGGVGSGKTFLAACIANALIDQGRKVLMDSMPSLVAGMGFGDDRAHMMHRLAGADLLILDDVGAERGTEYGVEQAYEIINTRYKSGKPLIVTTNMTPQMMTAEISAKSRGFDRLVEMCRPVIVKGESRRSEIAKGKRDRMIEILEVGQ